MKKIARFKDVVLGVIVCMIMAFIGIFFVGCENKYDNLKITLSQTEIILTLQDGNCQSETVIVDIEGDASISRLVNVSTEAPQLSLSYEMNDDGQTVITVSASAVCTNAVVVVKTLEGNKSVSFFVSVVEPVKMIQASALSENFFVVKGEAKNLNTAALIDFQPQTTTQKQLNFELVGNLQNVALENGVLFVNENFAENTITLKATSPYVSGTEILLTVNVLPQLSNVTEITKIEYPSGVLVPIFEEGRVLPSEIILSNNLAEKQSVMFSVRVESAYPVTLTPFVQSTGSQNSQVVRFANIVKNEINGAGGLVATEFTCTLNAENVSGQDFVFFTVKFTDFNHSYSTTPIKTIVKESVNKLELYVDNTLSNQTIFTVYDKYSNKKGLKLCFNALPTTITEEEKVLVLELGVNAHAYQFYTEDGEIIFLDGKFEFKANDNIYVKATKNALNGQIKVYAKENAVVQRTLTFKTAAGTTEMKFTNASGEVDLQYYYFLSSNQEMSQTVKFTDNSNDISAISLEVSGDSIQITTMPYINGNHFEFVVKSVQGKTGTSVITLRQANGFYIQAFFRVIYELVEDEVSLSVPSAQTNAYVGFMESSLNADWQFRVAISLGGSITLTQNGKGVESVQFGFYELIHEDADKDAYEYFFDETKQNLNQLHFSETSQVLDNKFLNMFELKPKQVGKAWVKFSALGFVLEERIDGNEIKYTISETTVNYYFLVEGYVPVSNFELSTYSVSLYSQNSVGYEDYSLTTENVQLNLNDATYQNVTWLSISEVYKAMDKEVYRTNLSDDQKNLSITALSTYAVENGELVLKDSLEFAFVVLIKEFNTEYRLALTVKILRAQQVERILAENVNVDEGIYIPLTKDGNNITRAISAVVQVGESGIMPFNTKLVYEFLPYLSAQTHAISVNRTTGLITIDSTAEKGEVGVIRIAPADRYNSENQYQAPEKDIAIYINIVVADGQSRETAYRITSLDGFTAFSDSLTQAAHQHFVLLNDITITQENALGANSALFDVFYGGLYGALNSDDKTYEIKTQVSLFDTIEEDAGVCDLVVSGDVNGVSFIAKQNKGKIENVSVVSKTGASFVSAPSVLKVESDAVFAGGIVAVNSGSILNSTFSGQILGQGLTNTAYVGGIAGNNSGIIDLCAVEFCSYVDAFSASATVTFDKIEAGAATVGGLVGNLTGGSLTNSYVQSYVDESLADSLINGQAAVLVGSVQGGSIDVCFGNVQTQQNNIYGSIEAKNTFINNAYINYTDSDKVLGKYIANFVEFLYIDNPAVFGIITDLTVWDKTTVLPTFNNLKIPASITEIPQSFEENINVFSGVITHNAQTFSAAVMFLYEVNETLSVQEKFALDNLNYYAFSKLFSGNIYGLEAYSSNPQVISVTNSGINLLKTGTCDVTFYSKYNNNINKTYTICVMNPVLAPVFTTGSINFKNKEVINVKASNGFGFVLEANSQIVLDERVLNQTLQPYELVFGSQNVVGNNPYSVNTYNLPNGHTQIEYNIKITDLEFEDLAMKVIGDAFKGSFTLNLYNGADLITLSHTSVVMQPYDTAEIEVKIYTDTSIQNGENLLVNLQNVGTFPQNIFNINMECIDAKFFTNSDLLTETTEDLAKYYIYTYSVRFEIIDEYKNLNFAANSFIFNITSQTAQQAQNVYGIESVYATCEIVINTQEILSVSTNHYEKTNKTVLFDETKNKNFVFYQYNTRQSTNVLAPGEEGLLKIDVYPNYAQYNFLDITYSSSVSGLNMQFSLMEKHFDSELGEGFKLITTNYQTLDNGIRVFNTNAFNSQSVTTLYIGTYLPLSTNKDAVFTVTLTSSTSQGETVESSFNLVVEYIDDAVIDVVDELGQTVVAAARGSSTNLLITLPKEQNLTLDNVAIIGIVGAQATPETSVYLSRQQIIEEEYSLTRTYKYLLTVGSDVKLENNANYLTIEVSMSWIVGGKLQKKISTYTLGVVDFKIDEITLKTDSQDKATFYSYIGVESSLNFDFKTSPSQNDAITEFLANKYYEALSNVNNFGNYIANVGNENAASFLSNLYYVNGALTYPLVNSAGSYEANNYFTFTEENGVIKLTGTRQGEVNLRFMIEIQYPHPTMQTIYEISFDFTVVVQPYSDEDLPLIIDNETAFYEALNSGVAQDYILMSNLTLENHTPVNTQALNSFDGNNFVITIKSWAIPENATSINFALFNEVAKNTTLKNITVNVCPESELNIDVDAVQDVKVSGLAITNSGIIYNCAVVTSSALGGKSDAISGIKVSYSKEYISATTQSSISGFVITNNGYITNSRVGGETFETALSINQPLEVFAISGQGNISGFVDNNNGTIASSFFANGTLTNNSIGSLSTTTSGFVRRNNGTITTSYAKGTGDKAFSLTGQGITTSGLSAGFVGENNGHIADSYSNIFLASTSQGGEYQAGRLSAGFVQNNAGTIVSCFTSSKIQNSKTTQMAFVGVDDKSNILNTGSIKYSYYYNEDELEGDAYSDENSNLNIVRVAEPNNPENFYGFAFADSASSVNGVWYSNSYGIDLVSANQIAISSRYVANQRVDENTGELLSYNLPYTDGYDYGSIKNPIIIRSAEEFNRVFGGDDQNAGTAISRYYNLSEQKVYGHYRIITDINLQDLNPDTSAAKSLKSTEMTLYGAVIDGNMLTVSGVDITARNDTLIQNYGLFKSLENGACIKNLNVSVVAISAKQARFVGVVAGTIDNSKAISITISAEDEITESTILGNNIIGGLSGVVKGDSQVKNIVVSNLSLKANALATGAVNRYQRTSQNTNVNTNLSYAGGVIGVADIYTEAEKSSSYHKTDTQIANLANLVVNGVINIRASSAGGVIGYLGPQTNLRDVTLEIQGDEASKIVAYNFFAGGIVAECYGNIDMARAQHDPKTQKEIENIVSDYYHSPSQTINRGTLRLFDDTSDGNIISTYSPIGIGGLVGALYTGDITHAYSKLNVLSGAATYAGGLVGGVLEINNPLADRNKINLFEVYAFGDVAAKTAAGGIVGFIDNSRNLTMAKVNAVNYWGLEYNAKEQSYSLKENAYQIYALTDHKDEYVFVDSLVNYNQSTNIVTLISGALPTITCTSNAEDMFSVTAVKFNNGKTVISEYVKQSFAFMVGKQPFNMVLDPYYGLQDDQKTQTEYYSTQAITPYYDLIDVTTNGIAMDTYFIQANWDTNYWVRYSTTNDLLPSLVTYTESMSYYIDVAEDLQKMVYHPYATFIVRALNQPSTIIPVGGFIKSTGLTLSNFYGTLKGFDQTQKYGFDFDGETSFIQSATGASFYNLTFTGLGDKENAQSTQNQAIIDLATLTTFENILVSNSITNTQANKNNYNIGILTNKMIGGYVNNVSFQDCEMYVDIEKSINSLEMPSLNVGMLAGQIETNTSAMLQLSDICVYQSYNNGKYLNNGANNIKINTKSQTLSATQINVGALVGETNGSVGLTYTSERLTNGLNKQIGVACITNGEPYVMEKASTQNINGSKLSILGGGEIQSVNAGLLFGKASTAKIGLFGSNQNQKLQVVGGITLENSKPVVHNANVGGLIGKVETFASIQNTLNSNNKFLEVDVNIMFDADVLNAGMIFGSAASVQEIANIETFGQINAKSGISAKLGGVVGEVNSSLNINNVTSNTVIRSTANKTSYVGGMVGMFAPSSGTLNLGGASANTKFAGNLNVNGEEVYVGGLLGAVKTEKGANAEVNIKFVASGGNISVGEIKSGLYAGGIIGSAKENSSDKLPKVSIENSLSYGNIKVHYNLTQTQNAIAVGGIIGAGSKNTTLSGNTSLASVASKTSATLSGVNIGAIIGISNNSHQGEALNYYSHQVSLCLELSEGIGATNLYYQRTDATLEENDVKKELSISTILENYKNLISTEENLEGSKLNPIIISSIGTYQDAQVKMQAEKEAENTVYMLITKPLSLSESSNITPVNLINTHLLGDGYEIINSRNLFNTIDENSCVTGVSLIPSITELTATNGAVGALANVNDGFVFASAVKTTNISLKGHTSLAYSGAGYVGGLVGKNNGVVMDSMTSINIKANGQGGALVGFNSGVIISSYAVGTISGGFAFGTGNENGKVYSSYSAAKADKGVFGTHQTLEDCLYDIYATGVQDNDNTIITDTKTFSVLDSEESKKSLLFTSPNQTQKFAYVADKNFGYPSFAGNAYKTLSYMQGIDTGNGTEENPIKLPNVGKLQQINFAKAKNLNYLLITDIELTGDMKQVAESLKEGTDKFDEGFRVASWQPISNFEGKISGLYGASLTDVYTIKNITTSFAAEEWSVFGNLKNATISNLKVVYDGLSVQAPTLAGLAVSIDGTTIDNISLEIGDITSTSTESSSASSAKLAGLVATVNAENAKNTISNITLNITSIKTSNATSKKAYAGGLIAEVKASNYVTQLSNISQTNEKLSINVDSSQESIFGGLIGYAQNVSLDQVTLSKVDITSGSGSASLGGLFGTAKSITEGITNTAIDSINLTSSADVGKESALGGVVGTMDATTIYGDNITIGASGVDVSMKGSGKLLAGGVAGKAINESTISKLSPSLKVTVDKEGQNHIGGLAGDVNGSSVYAETVSLEKYVITLNSTEAVTNYIGGIVGKSVDGTISSTADTKATLSSNISLTNKSTGTTYFGGVAGTVDGGIVSSIELSKLTLSGTRVGAVAGQVSDANISTISLTDCKITAEFFESSGVQTAYAGALASQIKNSTLGEISVSGGSVGTNEIPKDSTPTTYIGGLAGTFSGVLSQGQDISLATTINITTGGYAGGLFGLVQKADTEEGTQIIGAKVSSTVSATLAEAQIGEPLFVGGVAGRLTGKVTTVKFTGSSKSTNAPALVGGIAGVATEAVFTNCVVGGTISEEAAYKTPITPTNSLSGGTAVGGIAGYASGSIFQQNYVGAEQIGANVSVFETTVSGTYAAGGFVGEGKNLTFTGDKVVNIDGTVMSSELNYNYATVKAATESTSLVTNAYAGGIVGKLSEGTVKYCENFGQIQAGWQNTDSSNKLTARDMFYLGKPPAGAVYDYVEDEDNQSLTLNKLNQREKTINDSAKGAEKSYASGIVGYSSGAELDNLVNNGEVIANAKVQLELDSSSRYDRDGYALTWLDPYDSYCHYAKETENAYAAGIAYTEDVLGKDNKNLNQNIYGGGIVEFNIYTTDEGDFYPTTANIYKSYVIGYEFDMTADKTQQNAKNYFETLYKNDTKATAAWVEKQSEITKLVGSDTAYQNYVRYGEKGYMGLQNSADNSNLYVLRSAWTGLNENIQNNYTFTTLHYAQPSIDYPYSFRNSVVFAEGTPLLESRGVYKPAYWFAYSDKNDSLTPYVTYYEKQDENGITYYYYYEPTIVKGARITHIYKEITLGNPATSAEWGRINSSISMGIYYYSLSGSYQAVKVGGDCSFANKNNIDTEKFAYNLSKSDGKPVQENVHFKLSTNDLQLVDLTVCDGKTDYPSGVRVPEITYYDEELSPIRPGVWGEDHLFFEVYHGTEYDKGKIIWQIVYHDALNNKYTTVLHWSEYQGHSVLTFEDKVIERVTYLNYEKYEYEEGASFQFEDGTPCELEIYYVAV